MAQRVPPVVPVKKKSNAWSVIAGILLLLSSIAIFVLNKDGESKAAEVARLERNLKLSEQQVRYYKNDLGERIAQIEAKQYTKKEFKEFEEETYKRIQEIAGNVKEVREYVKFKSKVKDTVYMVRDSTIFIVDQAGNRIDSLPFVHHDKYMSIDGLVRPHDVVIDYEYRPGYEIVGSFKKPPGAGMFAKKQLMVDIVPENPKEMIVEASSIQILQPRTKFYDTKAFWATLSYILGGLTKVLLR